MLRFRVAALALVTLLAFQTSVADGCTTYTTSKNDPPEHVVQAAGSSYLVVDGCAPGCIVSVWIYEESNGRAGLQRGDEVVDDTCGGIVPSDTPTFSAYSSF